MRKFLSFIGFTAAAVFSGTVVYLYLSDKEVHDKVNTAVDSIGAAVQEVKRGIELNRMAKDEQRGTATERNQAWVEEQWEALGV